MHFHYLINIIILVIAMVMNYIYSEQFLFKAGVINGTAPNPVRLAEMCEQLGSVLGRPSWLPVPDIALKAVLGEGATVVYLLFLGTFCYLPIYLSRSLYNIYTSFIALVVILLLQLTRFWKDKRCSLAEQKNWASLSSITT